jgi:hypothetical protein
MTPQSRKVLKLGLMWTRACGRGPRGLGRAELSTLSDPENDKREKRLRQGKVFHSGGRRAGKGKPLIVQ